MNLATAVKKKTERIDSGLKKIITHLETRKVKLLQYEKLSLKSEAQQIYQKRQLRT